MTDEKHIAQMVTIMFSNGAVGRFVGPAVVFADDGPDGRIGVQNLQVGPPFELSKGTFFAETKDGVIVLMKAQEGETDTFPIDRIDLN